MRFLSMLLAVLVMASDFQVQTETRGDPVKKNPSYSKDIRPLLEHYCLECHQGPKAKSGVDVSSYQSLMKGDKKGRKTVIPGDPNASRLLHTLEGKAKQMPPKKSPQMRKDEIVQIRAWIAAGARNDQAQP